MGGSLGSYVASSLRRFKSLSAIVAGGISPDLRVGCWRHSSGGTCGFRGEIR